METNEHTDKQDRDSSPVRPQMKAESCYWCSSEELTTLRFNQLPTCFRCLRHFTPGAPRLDPYKFDSCENCNNDYCLNIHLVKKSHDEGFQCCACYRSNSTWIGSWIGLEECFACFQRPLVRRKWTTVYFSQALDCDMPVLESLFCLDYRPWHECIDIPRYNLLLIGCRRCQFNMLHYHIFQSEIVNQFCGILRLIMSTNNPTIRGQPVFQKFAEEGTNFLIALVDCALSMNRHVYLFAGMQTVRIFEALLNTLNVTFPELLLKAVPKMKMICKLYNVDPEMPPILPEVPQDE